jgi:hypothetical protein
MVASPVDGAEFDRVPFGSTMKKLLPLALALLVLAAACGDSDSDSGASLDPRIAELSAGLMEGDVPIEQGEADCASAKVVEELDDEEVQALIALGGGSLDDSDLSPAAQAVAFDAVLDCIDVQRVMRDGMIDDGATEEQADCVVGEFGEDELRTVFETLSSDDEDATDAAAAELVGTLFSLAATCGLG